jgi:hypothetical protein
MPGDFDNRGLGPPLSGQLESHAQWAFGAGLKATTWVSQIGEETIAEHSLIYYTATKSLAMTPGHATAADLAYRTFDPVATALSCFRCHSTGPVTLAGQLSGAAKRSGHPLRSLPRAGAAHAESGGAGTIQNPSA